MLQAVSGGAVFGVISQIPALQSNAGRWTCERGSGIVI
jgi:hypothetical protein